MSIQDTGLLFTVLERGVVHSSTPQDKHPIPCLIPHLAHRSRVRLPKWSLRFIIRRPPVLSQCSAASSLQCRPAFSPKTHFQGFFFCLRVFFKTLSTVKSTLLERLLRRPRPEAISKLPSIILCLNFYIGRLSVGFDSFIFRYAQTTTIPHSIKSLGAIYHLLDLNLCPPAEVRYIVPWSPMP